MTESYSPENQAQATVILVNMTENTSLILYTLTTYMVRSYKNGIMLYHHIAKSH